MCTILCAGVIVAQLLLTARAENMGEPSWDCQHPSCQLINKFHSGIATAYEFEVEGKTMWLYHGPQTLRVFCVDEYVLESAALPRASSTLNVSNLQLDGCPLPAASSLRAVPAALNVALHCNNGDQDSLCELDLMRIPSMPSLTASHFLGLEQLQELTIDVNDPITLEHNILLPLQNLSKLFLRNVILPIGETIPTSVRNLEVHYVKSDFNARGSLPVSSAVEMLYVYGWRNPEPQPLSNCEALRELYVSDTAVQSLPDYWVANCSRLEHLQIEYTKNFSLTPKLLSGARALKSVNFDTLELKMAPARLFDFLPNLQSVQLTRNHLHTLPRDLFSNARQVRELVLSGNELRVDVIDALKPLENLTRLDLSNNPGFEDICSTEEGYSPLRNLSQLIALTLSETGVRRICRDWLEDMPRLQLLDLSGSKLSHFSLQDLQFKGNRPVEVDLWNMDLKLTPPILNQSFAASDYKNNVTVYISHVPLVDSLCGSNWIQFALRLLQIKFIVRDGYTESWKQCDVSFEEHWYPWSEQCEAVALPSGCFCESRQDEDSTQQRWIIRVRCENRYFSSFPRLSHNSSYIYDFYLAHNNITELHEHDLQHDIRTLDLSNNPLQVMDDITAKRLDNVKGILRLAGNQMNCSCRIMPLLRALQTRSPSLTDFSKALCSDGRTLYAAVNMDCSSGVPLAAWLVLVIVCLALALVLGAATVRFFWSRQRRFFARAVLHRWGWTRRAEENDDRRFDAFLTFSHRDSAVARAVMTRLELRYRLCVHVRDWTPGEMILTQIVESVQDSRRTVALVSRHFLASKWARAEFREAHLAAMLDERPRLVVVLLEDPRELRMEEQLSGYIATRTYLRWGEALFWDKLAVALPPPRENYSFEEHNFLIEESNIES